ncbi:MAG: hypothetical protein PHQ32_02480 [Firmicutes bacterium]|nr:hypothetical protein [Bacillota bacterium]
MKYQFECDEIKSCNECPCVFYMCKIDNRGEFKTFGYECNNSDKKIIDETIKPDWCPLVEVE